jgi:hypothetical protein
MSRELSYRVNKLFLFILMNIFLSGCASHFISFTDESSNATIVRMNGNRLAGGMSSLELNAQRFEKEGQISYSLFIRYSGLFFLNIDQGKSLLLIIDGQPTQITGSGSNGRRNYISIGLVEEVAYYHNIEPDLIRKIAYAKQVEIEVQGSTTVLKRYFKTKNLLIFKEFYNSYMEKTTGSS